MRSILFSGRNQNTAERVALQGRKERKVFMRKALLIVAMLLLVTPVMATTTITATPEGSGAGYRTVSIGYVTDVNVRAFALDINVDAGPTFSNIRDFNVGESNGNPGSGKIGYGIFPGRFRDYIVVTNPNWTDPNYNPTVASSEPGASGTGMGQNKMIVELGSLYTGDANKPKLSGTLFRFDVVGTAGTYNLAMVADALRGGVVNVDGNAITATLQGTSVVIPAQQTDCFPNTDPGYNDWVTFGKPTCWCFPRQCHGDADGLAQGSAKAGFAYVGTNDLNIFVSAFNVLEPTKGPGIATIPNGICADFDHQAQGSAKAGFARVGTNDLNVFVTYFNVLEPTKGPGVPGDCGGNINP